MVKDHLDSERGNPLLPHGLRFLISSKGSGQLELMGERKGMLYLTMYFYLWLYGVGHIQIAREETCCHHYMGYSFQLAAKFLLFHPTDMIAHALAFVTPVVDH